MDRKRERRQREARRGKLQQNRRGALVDRVAFVMRSEWIEGRAPTKLTYEAAFVATIRMQLCLAGWRWRAANVAAHDVVCTALDRIGAKRPTWYEGQREFEDRFIERTRCIRCHKALPEDRRKFCSDLCGTAHAAAVGRTHRADEARVREMVA